MDGTMTLPTSHLPWLSATLLTVVHCPSQCTPDHITVQLKALTSSLLLQGNSFESLKAHNSNELMEVVPPQVFLTCLTPQESHSLLCTLCLDSTPNREETASSLLLSCCSYAWAVPTPFFIRRVPTTLHCIVSEHRAP